MSDVITSEVRGKFKLFKLEGSGRFWWLVYVNSMFNRKLDGNISCLRV